MADDPSAGAGSAPAPSDCMSLEEAARTVLTTFQRDEAAGYRSRDRQFAIELLGAAFANMSSPGSPAPAVRAGGVHEKEERKEVPYGRTTNERSRVVSDQALTGEQHPDTNTAAVDAFDGPAAARLDADNYWLSRENRELRIANKELRADVARLTAERDEWIARFNKLPEIVQRAEDRGRLGERHTEAELIHRAEQAEQRLAALVSALGQMATRWQDREREWRAHAAVTELRGASSDSYAADSKAAIYGGCVEELAALLAAAPEPEGKP